MKYRWRILVPDEVLCHYEIHAVVLSSRTGTRYLREVHHLVVCFDRVNYWDKI
jgi:hypothetical protein